MSQDDTLDKELKQLDDEIEAKVDSLFVEADRPAGAASGSAEDPWKGLRAHFLALEWEIDPGTLEKISQEIQGLQSRYPEGHHAQLLGWMNRVTERIQAQGDEVDQDSMRVFHNLKEGLMRLADDPSQDPAEIVNVLRAEVEAFLGEAGAEGEGVEGEEALLFEELDEALEEALEAGEEGGAESEAAASEFEETLILEEGRKAAEEATLGDTEIQEPATLTAEEEAVTDLAAASGWREIKESIRERAARIQRIVEAFRGSKDPVGLSPMLDEARQRLDRFFDSVLQAVGDLHERLDALEEMALRPEPPEEPEPRAVSAAEPQQQEELLFVSMANRVFGIPMGSVEGIFRVPSQAVAQVLRGTEVSLKGRNVPLVPLWRKLGLARALYPFPREEKRVVLVSTDTGATGLLVDRVLARKRVGIRQMEAGASALFKGMAMVEKEAPVVNAASL